MDWIPKFDLFGNKPALSVNKVGNKSFKTFSGGILSIMFILSSILVFCYFFVYSMLFNKSGSIVSFYKYTKNNNYSSFILGKDIYLGIFAFDYQYSPIRLDSELYSINIISSYIFNDKNSSVTSKNQTIVGSLCNTNEKSDFLKSKNSFVNEYHPICFNNGDQLNFGGDILESGSLFYTRLIIYVNTSNPNSENALANINEVGIISGFNSPQILDFNNPKFYTEIVQYLTPKTKNDMNIQLVSFVSYENIIPFNEASFNQTYPIVYSFSQQSMTENILEIEFILDNNILNVNRKYDTIDLYLAKYSSIFNLLLLIFSNITYMLNENHFYLSHINKFIKIKHGNHVKNQFENESDKLGKDKLRSSRVNFKTSIRKKNWKSGDFINLDSYLEISFCDLICGRKSSKFQEYQYYCTILDSIVSYESIVNVITDFKRFKYLLFDEDEEKVFDFYYINRYYDKNFTSTKNREIPYAILEKIMNRFNKKSNKCFSLEKLISNDFDKNYVLKD